jgi:4-amino-4-deoxy-L-arabinose transferase-like glycosyltransferase
LNVFLPKLRTSARSLYHAEFAWLALIVLAALAFRLPWLDAVPPGLQHDEIFYAQDAGSVRHGNTPVYFESNNGREPFYIYLMAGTLSIFGHNAFGIRAASAICGILTVLLVHMWGREAWGVRVGLFGAAVAAVTFWPVYLSRAGLRAVSLPMFAALTGWLFARALNRPKAWGAWALAGAALGATQYTYLAARVVPGVYVMCFVVLLIFKRSDIRESWKRWVLFTIVALVVSAPLLHYLLTTPGVEARLDQLGGPLDALESGDPIPVIEGTLQTLGMFTFHGDPVWRYNLAGRPVFDWGVGLLLYGGVALSLWRWRNAQHTVLVIGLLVGLAPSAVTPTPPSFLRAGAALPAALLLPALGVDAILTRLRPHIRRLAIGAAAGVVVTSGVLTALDYFERWPANDEVIAAHRGDLRLVAAWLEDARPGEPVVIGTSEPHHLDPFILDYTPHGSADVRWVDALQALVIPDGRAHYISPATTPLNPRLTEMFFPDAAPVPAASLPNGESAFYRYDLDASERLDEVLRAASGPVYASSAASFDGADPAEWAVSLDYPVNLAGRLDFLGYTYPGEAHPGSNLELALFFGPTQDSAGIEPLAIFAHLLTLDGQVAAGRDFLAFPARDWRAGDVFVQLHDVWLDSTLPPGEYVLEVGVYSQADMQRFPVIGPDGEPAGDRLLLAPVEVVP